MAVDYSIYTECVQCMCSYHVSRSSLIRVERCDRFRLCDHAKALGLPATLRSSNNAAIVAHLRLRMQSAAQIVLPRTVVAVEPGGRPGRGTPVAGSAVSTQPTSAHRQHPPSDTKCACALPPLFSLFSTQLPLAHRSHMIVPRQHSTRHCRRGGSTAHLFLHTTMSFRVVPGCVP
jgi:hypothetical protein